MAGTAHTHTAVATSLTKLGRTHSAGPVSSLPMVFARVGGSRLIGVCNKGSPTTRGRQRRMCRVLSGVGPSRGDM